MTQMSRTLKRVWEFVTEFQTTYSAMERWRKGWSTMGKGRVLGPGSCLVTFLKNNFLFLIYSRGNVALFRCMKWKLFFPTCIILRENKFFCSLFIHIL